jgi:hypothetical protein
VRAGPDSTGGAIGPVRESAPCPEAGTVDLRGNAILNDFRRNGLTQAEFFCRRPISLGTFGKHLDKPRPSAGPQR